MEKMLFTADLHGNIAQYDAVLSHAMNKDFDIVIFGGDLTPKEPKSQRCPKTQRDFIQNELFPCLDRYKDVSNVHVLFIMGNDDFRSNHDLMVEGQDFHRYRMIDEIPYLSKDGHLIAGYTYVPSTPFEYKCWEKRDLASDRDFSARPDTRHEGVISKGLELVPYSLDEVLEHSSIEEDIADMTKGKDASKMILVTHAPPFETVCDYNRENMHVGSNAVRKAIEENQYLMTLHGHIHECVDLTGKCHENIGNTICVAAGNSHKPNNPYVIAIKIDDNDKVSLSRLQI